MKTQRKISFNYHQTGIERPNNHPYTQNHHLVSSHRILKFNYQLPYQPKQERIKTFQSISFDTTPRPIITNIS